MSGNGLHLHSEDRILLYLSNFGSLEDVYEAEPDVTQKGIALNVGVQRKHISRYLKNLVGEGMVAEFSCHVRDAKQRMKCYCLTHLGLTRAREIAERVGGLSVRVKHDGQVREMKVSEIDGATSVHLTLSDIVSVAMNSGEIIDMEELESIEESRRRMADEKSRKAEVYRNALAVAWRSGVLTASEKQLIDALRRHLGITDREHRSIEEGVMNSIPGHLAVHGDLYDEIANLVGDDPTPRERQILALIGRRLGREVAGDAP